MSSKDFIDYTPNSGNQTQQISVTAKENINDSERKTILNVSAKGISKTIQINQKAIAMKKQISIPAVFKISSIVSIQSEPAIPFRKEYTDIYPYLTFIPNIGGSNIKPKFSFYFLITQNLGDEIKNPTSVEVLPTNSDKIGITAHIDPQRPAEVYVYYNVTEEVVGGDDKFNITLKIYFANGEYCNVYVNPKFLM